MASVDLALDNECDRCEGRGWVFGNELPDRGRGYREWDELPCTHCEKRGRIPTELGYEILEFLKRYR